MAVVVVASIMRNPILKQNQKKDIVNNIKKTIFQYLKQVVQARIMRVCTTFQVPGRVVLPKRFIYCCAKVCKKKNDSFNVVWLQYSVTLSLFFVSVLVLFPPRFAFSFVFFIRHPFSSFATWTKRKVIHKLSLDSLWFHKNKWEFSLEKCVETNRVAILLWKPSTDNVSRRTNKRAIPCQKIRETRLLCLMVVT